ncbi:MAG TPA: hypothetical protein VH008_14690 [Pseudonocardia sp.]|jgi:hypothetical protein|nr:hypothetical protein [Pseudonocardia sp.]
MARYGPVWLDIAAEQYTELPADARAQVDARVEQLLENPTRSGGAYDRRTDQWTTTYGAGAGLLVYAVVHELGRIIILRLV